MADRLDEVQLPPARDNPTITAHANGNVVRIALLTRTPVVACLYEGNGIEASRGYL